MVAAALVMAMTALAPAPLSLEVNAAPCIDLEALTSLLTARGLRIETTASSLRVLFHGASPLHLKASRSGQQFARDIPTEGTSCASVLRVAAALIDAWARSAIPVKPKPIPVEPESMAVETRGEAEPLPPLVEAIEAPAQTVSTPPPRGEFDFDLPTESYGPPRERPLATVKHSVPTTPVNDTWSFDVGLLGGVTSELNNAAAVGAIQLRGGWSRFAVLLEGGLETERSRHLGDIVTSIQSQWASVSLSLAFEPVQRLQLDVAIGARGTRLVASATHLAISTTQDMLLPGGVASIGLHWRFDERWSVQLRPAVALRGQALRYSAEGVGTLYELPALSLGVLAGLTVHIQ